MNTRTPSPRLTALSRAAMSLASVSLGALLGLAGATQARAAAAPPADLRSACPGIDARLQQLLAPALNRVQQEGQLQVQMQLERGRVSEVRTQGWPLDYRIPVRRAVSGLNCSGAGAEHAALSFEIHFAEPGTEP